MSVNHSSNADSESDTVQQLRQQRDALILEAKKHIDEFIKLERQQPTDITALQAKSKHINQLFKQSQIIQIKLEQAYMEKQQVILAKQRHLSLFWKISIFIILLITTIIIYL